MSITYKTIELLRFVRRRFSLGRTWQTPRRSFSWETNSPFSSQEIPHLLRISVLCSFIYTSPVLSQMKPIHPLILYFLIIYFNIVFPFTSRSLKLFLRSRVSDRYNCFSQLSHVCYMFRPSLYLDLIKSTIRELVMQVSKVSTGFSA
jgi:hypothetical protein